VLKVRKFYVGLDLGQAQDYTAIAIVEHSKDEPIPSNVLIMGKKREPKPEEYHIRHLERPELGTPYPTIVERVQKLMKSDQLLNRTRLIVDATGVGRPVVDMFRQARLQPVAVTITGGNEVTTGNGGLYVPKRDLVSNLQVLFQSGKVKVARNLKLATVLVDELLNFKVKINVKTAHDSYEAWREGVHDDLVLAVALACWYAERRRPIMVVNKPEWW
jgi:hypothetical protein